MFQDFGIDKNLSERIMDMAIENLDPVRGSLEKVRGQVSGFPGSILPRNIHL